MKKEKMSFFFPLKVSPYTGQAIESYKHFLLAVCNLLLTRIVYHALASDV